MNDDDDDFERCKNPRKHHLLAQSVLKIFHPWIPAFITNYSTIAILLCTYTNYCKTTKMIQCSRYVFS
jgi:hypothetical protein